MKTYFLGIVIFFIYLFLFSHLEYKDKKTGEITTYYRQPINLVFALVLSIFWIITIPIMIINKLRSK